MFSILENVLPVVCEVDEPPELSLLELDDPAEFELATDADEDLLGELLPTFVALQPTKEMQRHNKVKVFILARPLPRRRGFGRACGSE
jgi:hypothetical protein